MAQYRASTRYSSDEDQYDSDFEDTDAPNTLLDNSQTADDLAETEPGDEVSSAITPPKLTLAIHSNTAHHVEQAASNTQTAVSGINPMESPALVEDQADDATSFLREVADLEVSHAPLPAVAAPTLQPTQTLDKLAAYSLSAGQSSLTVSELEHSTPLQEVHHASPSQHQPTGSAVILSPLSSTSRAQPSSLHVSKELEAEHVLPPYDVDSLHMLSSASSNAQQQVASPISSALPPPTSSQSPQIPYKKYDRLHRLADASRTGSNFKSRMQDVGDQIVVDPLRLSQQHLATVIEQSVKLVQVSDKVADMQQAITHLNDRISQLSKEKADLASALANQTAMHQTAEKKVKEQYEALLTEKQKEVQTLKQRIQQLESSSIKGKVQSKGEEVKLSGDELAALRKDIREQEALIKGYEMENQNAMRKIKELQELLARKDDQLAEESLKVERQTLIMQDDVAIKKADTASKLQRILNLEKELEAVKEQAHSREAELKATIDKLRSEKKELEARTGGVDLKQIQEDDVLVKQLQKDMEAMKQQYTNMTAEMASKLKWYAENQELLTKNDVLVKEQQEIIKQLEMRLAQFDGGTGKTPSQRVKELESHVASLSQALKSRAPASLAAVINAAKPSPEENAAVAALQTEVDSLRQELASKDQEYELQLRTYQQQYERLKSQYEERSARLEAATKSRGRVRELEKQIEDMRAMYTKKIRDLEVKRKQPDSATPAKTPPHSTAKEDMVPAMQLRAKALEVKKLQAELERKSKQVAELHLKLGEAEAKAIKLGDSVRKSQGSSFFQSPIKTITPIRPHTAAAMYSAHNIHQTPTLSHSMQSPPAALDTPGMDSVVSLGFGGRDQSSMLRELQQRCSELLVENGMLKQQLTSIQQSRPNPRADSQELADAKKEVELLKRKLEAADLALAAVQRSHTEAVEKAALLANESQRGLLRLHDEVAYKEGLKWQERVSRLEQELQRAKQNTQKLEEELRVAKSRQKWTPEAAQFAALESKLDDMARDQASREAKWRAIQEETKSLYEMQVDMMKRKWELALEAKNQEMQRFQLEVDALLREAQHLREQQVRQSQQQVPGLLVLAGGSP